MSDDKNKIYDDKYKPVALPGDYVAEPKGLLSILHPVSRRDKSLAIGEAAAAAFVAVFLIAMFTVLLKFVGWAFFDHSFGFLSTVGTISAVGVPLTAFLAANGGVVAERRKAVAYHVDHAYWAARDMLCGDQGPTRLSIEMLAHDGRHDVVKLRERTALALAEVARLSEEAGTASKGTHDQEADEFTSDAIVEIMRSARSEYDAIIAERTDSDDRARIEARKRLRAALPGAVAIARGQRMTGPRARIDTGDASINRIVANAEAALEIDPDLTDAAGARIDSLLTEHLPRLLERHADLSAHARIQDLGAADAELAEGLGLVADSIGEGVDGMNDERADALKTEVSFLRARRAGAELRA
jgi:hypothetical protein